jgi:hypothetical protein
MLVETQAQEEKVKRGFRLRLNQLLVRLTLSGYVFYQTGHVES